MVFLKRMKVGARIFLGFLVLLIFIAVQGGFVVRDLGTVEAQARLVHQTCYPVIESIKNLRYKASSGYVNVLSFFFHEEEEHAVITRALLLEGKALVAEIDEIIPQWKDDVVQKNWQALKKAWGDLEQSYGEAIKLGEEKRFDEARKFTDERLEPVNEHFFNLVDGIANSKGERTGGFVGILSERVEASAALSDATVEKLTKLALLLLGLGIVATLIISTTTTRGITAPLKAMQKAMERIAAGEDVTVTGTERGDELGAIARALESIRGVGAGAVRVKAALDCVSTNVTIADNDGVIVYTNGAIRQMFARDRAAIASAIPGFDPEKIIGSNIDRYHREPSRQRAMLQALKGQHQAEITIGTQRFRLRANPIVNEQKQRLGTVVEWENITQQLRTEEEIAALIDAAAQGDLGRRLDVGGKEGFFRTLALGINRLSESMSVVLTRVKDVLSAMAGGDLSQRMEGDYHGIFAAMRDDANATLEKLSGTVGQIVQTGATISTTAGAISVSSAELSRRTAQQADSLQRTSSSMEEFSATVRQNSDNAQQANQLATATRSAAERGGHVVGEAVQAMENIEAASKKISDIIGVIDEIAFQTNLLALNAAVEAARAGDAGKGFAVVATEVRALAQRSSQASKEIKELILNSGDQVQEGVQLVRRAGDSLGEIVGSVKRVADIVAEIAAASREQAVGIEQVNQAVGQMDEATRRNAEMVEQNTGSSRQLDEQAGALKRMMDFFRTSVDVAPLPVSVAVEARKVLAARAPAPRPAPVPLPAPTMVQKPVAVNKKPLEVPKPPPTKEEHAAPAPVAPVVSDDDWKEF